jgi:imidazolonepropionase-like amidohydrolase
VLKSNFLFISLILFITVGCSNSEPRTILKVRAIYDPVNGLIDKKIIIIEKTKIKEVTNSYKKNNSDLIHDYSSMIAMPSFIEAHTHIFLEDETYDKDFSMALVKMSQTPNEIRLKHARARAESLLRSGFTTIRDLGNSGRYLDAILKEEIKNGKSIGPDIEYSGPGICINKCQFNKHISSEVVKKEYDVIKNIVDGKSIIDKHIEMKVDWIKIYSDNTPGEGLMNSNLLKDLVNYAKEKGVRVAVHAIESNAVEQAVDAAPHSIEHIEKVDPLYFYKMNVAGISFVSTEFSDENFKKRHEYKHSVKNTILEETKKDFIARKTRLTNAKESGTNIAYGADFYFPVKDKLKNYGSEILKIIDSYKALGFTNAEILKMLTVNGALLLGRESELGKMEPGFKANLILVKDNPFKNLSTILSKRIVMKDGKLIQ